MYLVRMYKEREEGWGCLKRVCSCREGRKTLRHLTQGGRKRIIVVKRWALLHTHTCTENLSLDLSFTYPLSFSCPDYSDVVDICVCLTWCQSSFYCLWKIPESLDWSHTNTMSHTKYVKNIFYVLLQCMFALQPNVCVLSFVLRKLGRNTSLIFIFDLLLLKISLL